jgi:hypothetical protein
LRLKARAALVGLTVILITASAVTASASSARPAAKQGTAVALDWQPLPAGPAPASNPLKGFMPYAGSYSTIPYSMEWFYIPLNAVMTGPDRYDWTALEDQLNAIAGRGHQAALRFYLDYPGKPSGVPQYLFDEGLACHSYPDYGNNGTSCSPDYANQHLDAALDEFIAAFGQRYDGDPRIGFIELGLLGFWGEWHTYPYNGQAQPQNWFALPAEQNRLMDGYLAAFHRTRLLVRYPAPCNGCSVAGTDNASLPLGYHDDSFALETDAGSLGWHFMDLMAQGGATGKWRSQPIGGELRPEIQACIFDLPYDCPDIEAGGDNGVYGADDFAVTLGETHASWLLNQTAFAPGYSGAALTRAVAASQALGYQFTVTSAAIEPAGGQAHAGTPAPAAERAVLVGARIEDTGAAPFYYNWPVQIAAVDTSGQVVGSAWPRFDLATVQPGAPAQFTVDLRIHAKPAETYSIVMRVVNPLPGGVPLRFANAGQDQTLPGWLTLGTVSF